MQQPQDFTHGLQHLRERAEDFGFLTRDTDKQQQYKTGDTLYHLDSGYASNAIHIRLLVRKTGAPGTKELGAWRPQLVTDRTIDLIWADIAKTIRTHRAKDAR